MSLQTKRFYEFAGFRLDLSEKLLLSGGSMVPLAPKVFDTLNVLIENAGHLLEKDELIRKIWEGRFVDDSNLTFNIKMLRKALGDDAAKPRFIETVPRRGYRFIAEVGEVFIEAEIDSVRREQSPLPAGHNSSQRSTKRFYAAFAAVGVLLIGMFVFGSWLARSGNRAVAAPVLHAPFRSEKLSTNGQVVHALITPDGKNVVYTNGISDRQSVWLRQLETGNNVEIIPTSDNVYAGLAVSPDGDFLYFVRRPSNAEKDSAVYRVSIFGGVPAKIISETHGWISVSPDGGKISFVRCYYREDENCALWIADASDGKNERKIASRPPPFRIGDNEFSPDGTSIAFAAGQSENAATEFGLAEVDIASGAERELTAEKFFNIKNLAWLPDRSGLLVTASKIPNKSFRIWQLSTATGEAQPLTNDSETYSALSLNNHASLLVSTQVKRDFRLVLFDIENQVLGRALTDAANVAFAPSGKILFSSSTSGNDEIWSINPDGSEQKQLTNNPADELAPVVSTENKSIFFASNRTGEVHVWRMNIDGTNQVQITQKEGGFPIFASPDGKWLYYTSGLQRTLLRVAVESGEEQLIHDKARYRFAVSPDGLRVAFSEIQDRERRITIASLPGGDVIKTFPLTDREARMVEVTWLNSGKEIIYILANSESENNVLWRQTLDGGEPRKMAEIGDDEVWDLALSPDNKSLAIVQGRWKHDSVLISGLK